MVEFAKLACEEQKKICSIKGELGIFIPEEDRFAENQEDLSIEYGEGDYYEAVNRDSILNSPTVKFK